MTSSPDLRPHQLVVFFDGECNLCNGSVNFLIDRDPLGVLRYASLQSPIATLMLEPYPEVHLDDLDTVIVLQDGKVFQRSSAVLRIASALPKPWSWLAVGYVIPRPLRDAAYRFIARHRKQLVKKPTTCRLPDPDRLRRFLD